MSNRAERLRLAAPTMAAVYQRTFGVALSERVRTLLAEYPAVESPNWLSWEGHRITNVATTAGLRALLIALEEPAHV